MTTSYEAWLEEQEERTAIPMSAGEYDREETYIGGANHPDAEWLCSDRDVWYRNPFFTGTRTEGHPEDDRHELTPEEEAQAKIYLERQEEEYIRRRAFTILTELDPDTDDIPF